MAEEKQIICCPKCSGKLRVVVTERLLKVKCAHCKHEFEHGIPDAEILDDAVPKLVSPASEMIEPERTVIAKRKAKVLEKDIGWIVPVAAILGIALGIWLGGAPFGPWPEIDSFWTWLWKAGVSAIGGALVLGIGAVILGFVLMLAGTIWVGMLTAFTWAWLGHGTEWREKPYQWAMTEFPEISDVLNIVMGNGASTSADKPKVVSANLAQKQNSVPKAAGTSSLQRQSETNNALSTNRERKIATSAPPSKPYLLTPSSVERDTVMLGLTDAWKAENSEKVLEYAQQLQKLGGNVPPTVHYFSAEASLKMRKFPAALAEARAYLELGSTARYYEQALRASLKADEGLKRAREQWNQSLASLVNDLGGQLNASVKWREKVHIDNWPNHFECHMSLHGGSVKVVLEPGKIVARKTEGPRPSEKGCVELSGAKGFARPGTLDAKHEVPSYLEIPIDQINKISVFSEYVRCSKRYDNDLCKSTEIGILRDSQGKEWWLLGGYSADYARKKLKTLQKLYEENGKSLF